MPEEFEADKEVKDQFADPNAEKPDADTQKVLDQIAAEMGEADKEPLKDTKKEPEEEPKKEDKGEEGKEEEPPKGRTPQFMPVHKHTSEKNEWRKKEAELTTEIEKLKSGSKPDAPAAAEVTDEWIDEMATKHNTNPEFIKDLVGNLAKSGKFGAVSDDIAKELDLLKSERAAIAAEKQKATEERMFQEDLANTLKASPDIPDTPEVREKIKELAYSTEYANYKLADIIRLHKDDIAPIATKGAEKSRMSGQTADVVDFDNLSEEEFQRLSPKQLDEFNAYMAKKEGVV